MRINIFMLSAENDNLKNVLRKMHRGILSYYSKELLSTKLNDANYVHTQRLLKTKDIWVGHVYAEKFKDCNVAIQFGSAKARDSLHHVVKTDIKEKAENILYIETPLLGRTINNKHDYNYYRIGLNGFLNGDADFNNDSSPPDRWNELKNTFGYKDFTEWKDHTSGAILLLAQLPGDASLRSQSMAEWIQETICKIRQQSDRKIIVRLHPAMSAKGKAALIGDMYEAILDNMNNVEFSNNGTLVQDLNRSGICISYTSGSSIDAVLHGVPCIACDEGNFVYPISSKDVDDFTNPYLADKDTVMQWLYDLSYCQWSLAEIQDGTAWKHFSKLLDFDNA